MPADILSEAEAQALAELRSRPAATVALVAICLQGILALPIAAIVGPSTAVALGGGAATIFLFGRQIERTAGHWRPGLRLRLTWANARQACYPAAATAAATCLAAILAGGA